VKPKRPGKGRGKLENDTAASPPPPPPPPQKKKKNPPPTNPQLKKNLGKTLYQKYSPKKRKKKKAGGKRGETKNNTPPPPPPPPTPRLLILFFWYAQYRPNLLSSIKTIQSTLETHKILQGTQIMSATFSWCKNGDNIERGSLTILRLCRFKWPIRQFIPVSVALN